jgi:hypothetical protein
VPLEQTSERMGSFTHGMVLSLSLPGYSPSRDEAVIEVSISGSPMSGGGELLYLRKENGAWRVVARQSTWIS